MIEYFIETTLGPIHFTSGNLEKLCITHTTRSSTFGPHDKPLFEEINITSDMYDKLNKLYDFLKITTVSTSHGWFLRIHRFDNDNDYDPFGFPEHKIILVEDSSKLLSNYFIETTEGNVYFRSNNLEKVRIEKIYDIYGNIDDTIHKEIDIKEEMLDTLEYLYRFEKIRTESTDHGWFLIIELRWGCAEYKIHQLCVV